MKKIFFSLNPPNTSYGGGAFFVTDLKIELEKTFEITFKLEPNIDLIFIIDPRKGKFKKYSIDNFIEYKKNNKNTKLLYVVNECDIKREKSINIEPIITKTIKNCDSVVFISEWLKNYFYKKYNNIRNIIDKSIVINNACNLEYFYPNRNKSINKDIIKIVTHHWSNDYNKGFYIYNKLNELGKHIKFTYIGRYNKKCKIPKHVNYIEPMCGLELANELRKNDIYITASLYEPGGIHQLEGMACGLPILYRSNSGGIKETVKNAGKEFNDIKDLKDKLNNIINNYDDYKNNIDYNFLSSKRFTTEYLKLINDIIK